MNRFKNILYVSDGQTDTCSALDRAMALAENNHARLTVVDVIDAVDEDEKIHERFGVSLNRLLHDHRLNELANLIEPYQTDDQIIYTRVLSGSRFAEIIKMVMHGDYDLVIKASSSPANLEEHLLGSTDMHLLRKCPSPVWIDRPGKTIPYKQILAAVDPLGDAGAANNIMQLATSLAAREKAQLQVVHAWQFYGESMIRNGRAKLSVAEADALVDGEYKRRVDKLNALLKNYGLSTDDDNVHLVKGQAVPGILQASASADLIVMGTIGRVGIPGFFIGNTAEEVMQMTQTSILAVKPEGYISPLAQAA
jgi:nucleotide-binding universal stress UspA family protein